MVTIAPAAFGRGGTWGEGGDIVFAPSSISPLLLTSGSGEHAVPITELDPAFSHRFPHFLPGGRNFLLFATLPQAERGVFVGSIDGGEIRHLVETDTNAIYASGHLLFARQSALWAQAFDADRLALLGAPVLVADDVTWDRDRNVAAISASSDGKILYRTGASEARQLVWYDRAGARVGAIGEPDFAAPWDVQLSRDDRRVATRRTVDADHPDIWLIDADRGVPSRLTFDDAIDVWPVWSPDGQWIAFASTRNGIHDVYRRPASGTGVADVLFSSPFPNVPTDWSADGRFLVMQHRTRPNDPDLWALEVGTGDEPFPLAATQFIERHGQLSFDGNWLAYTSDESGRNEIYVQAFPEANGKWRVSTDGGVYPRWRPDGREIFYLGLGGELVAARVLAAGANTIELSAPETLFAVDIVGGGSGGSQSHQYDVSSDGRKFVINTVVDASSAPITLVLNWAP